jgi:hypothetical protein
MNVSVPERVFPAYFDPIPMFRHVRNHPPV